MSERSRTDTAQAAIEVANPLGLHARPSVRLTQLAKRFTCRVEIALAADGPWVDAKSPLKVMRVRAPRGATLHVRSTGKGAGAAAAAILDLVRDSFGECGGVSGKAGNG